jgi:protein-tyrosine phosphatase
MIDLHCHLLPGIDDGALDMDQAVSMARLAYDNGIRYSIVTPHIHPGRYENTALSISRSCELLKAELTRAQIPLRLGMAAEVRLSPEILQLIEQQEIPFLGELDGYRIMLLEFPHSHIPPGAEQLVKKLLDLKVRPIIAHPERNKDVIRRRAKIEPFIEMGCFLQLTSSAVAGRFGEVSCERAIEMLKSDTFMVLATDAHNLKGRYPDLREGFEAAADIIGAKAARRLVFDNPMAIVETQFARSGEPAGPATLKMPAECTSAQQQSLD